MEGKCALFKQFADLDAIPIVLDTKDPDEIVETLVRLRPTFGAVNLEDISAPRCFEIERRVIEALDCPVMHDDQHGTAIVVLSALMGATKLLGRDMSSMRVVVSGAGAAGVACSKLLLAMGVSDITVCDSRGILHIDRDDMNIVKADLARSSNPRGLTGGMVEALDGADVFLGVSAGVVPEELIATMAPNGIVFALSNPDPEIHPDVAAKYAAVVATGRSDFPNQINNVLAFPGVFRGALDAGARRITEKMMVAAAEAIFSVVSDDLAPDRIVPSPLDLRVGQAVAKRWPDSRSANRPALARLWLAAALAAPFWPALRAEPATTAACRRIGGRFHRTTPSRGCWPPSILRRCGPTVSPRNATPPHDPMAGLDSGAFTVIPVFTGQTLQSLQPGAMALSDAQVYREMVSALPEGVAAGDYATAAEDKPVLLVTGSTAKAWGGKDRNADLSTLAKHCDGLAVGIVTGRRAPRVGRHLPTARGARIPG